MNVKVTKYDVWDICKRIDRVAAMPEKQQTSAAALWWLGFFDDELKWFYALDKCVRSCEVYIYDAASDEDRETNDADLQETVSRFGGWESVQSAFPRGFYWLPMERDLCDADDFARLCEYHGIHVELVESDD